MKKKKNNKDHWMLLHENVPAPFNPSFDKNASKRYSQVTLSMTNDNYYANHTREECKAEWARRYDEMKSRL